MSTLLVVGLVAVVLGLALLFLAAGSPGELE